MGKKILSGIGFFLILLVLIAAASYVVLPKNNTREAGMLTPQANGFLGEPENTIDVLFLGNSESYCGFIPMEIWKEQGITSYVCGSSAQKLYQETKDPSPEGATFSPVSLKETVYVLCPVFQNPRPSLPAAC